MNDENLETQKRGHGEIALAAYLIWEKRGRPQGSDIECWLEAERQFSAEEGIRRALKPAGTSASALSVLENKGAGAKSKKSIVSGDGKVSGKIVARDERRPSRLLERA